MSAATTTTSGAPPAPLVTGRRTRAGQRLIAVGGALLTLIVLAALAAPFLAPWGPTAIDPAANLAPPSAAHPLGTDRNGMDIFSRLLYAARLDLGVAVGAVALAVVIGGAVGALVGFAGGWADEIAMRAMDIFQAFPAFVLALAVAAVLGGGPLALVGVIALVNAPAYVRLMRAEIRSAREHTYVEAARCTGNSPARILMRHLVPNCLTPVLVIAPLNCGWAMLILAGLSFVGLGVDVPRPEWGAMISVGAPDIVSGVWWTSLFPGLALFVTVLAFNLLGEGLLERRSPTAEVA